MMTALIAEEPAPATPPPRSPFSDPIFLLLPIGILFYLVVLMPMSRRQRKDQEQMLATLKTGAKVVLSSGIVGVVVTAKEGEDEIVVRSDDAKFRVKRYTVAQVVGGDTPAAK